MEQNYKNHIRLDLGFHGVLLLFIVSGLIGAIVNLTHSIDNDNFYAASLILLLFICAALMYAYIRLFPLKAQDRAIRAEENFRYYRLTGNEFPKTLRLGQIIALRFASDKELQGLTERAIKEKLEPKEIKKAIINWRADYHRV